MLFVSTVTVKERESASRSTEDEAHRKWHALFGDDACRKAGCKIGKENTK